MLDDISSVGTNLRDSALFEVRSRSPLRVFFAFGVNDADGGSTGNNQVSRMETSLKKIPNKIKQISSLLNFEFLHCTVCTVLCCVGQYRLVPYSLYVWDAIDPNSLVYDNIHLTSTFTFSSKELISYCE